MCRSTPPQKGKAHPQPNLNPPHLQWGVLRIFDIARPPKWKVDSSENGRFGRGGRAAKRGSGKRRRARRWSGRRRRRRRSGRKRKTAESGDGTAILRLGLRRRVRGRLDPAARGLSRAVGSHEFSSQDLLIIEGLRSQKLCLFFTSKCALRAQISKGLVPFIQIELLKTGGRSQRRSKGTQTCLQALLFSLFFVICSFKTNLNFGIRICDHFRKLSRLS